MIRTRVRLWFSDQRAHDRAAIIAYLAEHGRGFGYDMGRACKLRGGRLYPTLGSLERAGVIEGHWESPEPVGRPPRRYYTLTAPTVGRSST